MVPAFLKIIYTAVARSCLKNINMLSRKMRIDIFKGVIVMKCFRNPTQHIKLLCLAHFDMPFPPHVAQRVAQGVTVEREFRYKLSFKI